MYLEKIISENEDDQFNTGFPLYDKCTQYF
jgi:hypothetical protein